MTALVSSPSLEVGCDATRLGHGHHLLAPSSAGERRHSTRVGIKVKLFAGLRELAGWGEKELDNVTRVDEIWPAIGLGPEPAGLLYAVNKEYATRDRELREGDEVAVIPPVSGGDFRLSEEPLDVNALVVPSEVKSSRIAGPEFEAYDRLVGSHHSAPVV